MVLVLTNPRGSDGELAELLTTTQASQPALLQAINAAPSSAGLQASWAIDATNGVDSNQGTPAAPLKTMGEFNARMQGNFQQVAATLQLVGNVLDQPLTLAGSRFGLGASLSVFGTRTDLGAGTITLVTPLGPSSSAPFQLTTTGIDWTTIPVGSQLRFSTNGEIGMIVEVVDANNVIVGAIATATGSVFGSPVAGATVTAAALSRALPPVVNASMQSTTSTPPLLLQSLSFDAANAYSLRGGLMAQFYGCEMKGTNAAAPFAADSTVLIKCCRVTQTASSWVWESGTGSFDTLGLVAAGTGALLMISRGVRIAHTSFTLTGLRLSVSGGASISIGPGHIRNTAGPILCSSGAALVFNSPVNGSTGNTGIGIDVPLGKVAYFGSSGKPTVTGASDCRVGGIAKTYAQIPFTSYDATVPAAITGNGAQIVQI